MRGKEDRRRPKRVQVPWWDWWPKCRCAPGNELVYLLVYPRWGGVHVAGICPRSFVPPGDRFGFDPDILEVTDVKKPVRIESSPGGFEAPPDDLVADYPLLAEFLTATCYEDSPQVPRLVGTLLIFAQQGIWKACLRDRQEQRCLWVAASGFNDLVTVAEHELGDPAAVWRDDRLSGAETAKRQPKK